MAHLTEEESLLYVSAPELMPDQQAAALHLASCERCRGKVDEARDFMNLLGDPNVWTRRAADPLAAQLRAFEAQVAEEDRLATELLKPYEDASAARFAWADLSNRPEFHTGGVARSLCARANAVSTSEPLYALALADAAVSIASTMPDNVYPRNAIHQLRGDAWKERANALDLVGRFDEALEALDRAEAEYRELPFAGVGTVAVTYLRASVHMEQENFVEAERLAQESARAALHLGQTDRYMRARHMQGLIRAEQHQFAMPSRSSNNFLPTVKRRMTSRGSLLRPWRSLFVSSSFAICLQRNARSCARDRCTRLCNREQASFVRAPQSRESGFTTAMRNARRRSCASASLNSSHSAC